MLIYYFIFASLSILLLLEHSNRNKLLSYGCGLVIFAFLSLYAGLRSSTTGEDYESYNLIFSSLQAFTEVGLSEVLSFNYFFEPGFALYIALFKSFSNSYELFLFATALLNCLIFFRAASKLTNYIVATWLVYFSYIFFTHGLVAIRFGLASVIGLYVVYYLTSKHRGRAVVTGLFAFLFHTSAIALFVPILLSYIHINRKKLILFLLLALFMGALSLGEPLIRILLPGWFPRAESALNYIQNSQYGETLGFLGFINIKNLFVSFLILTLWKRGCVRYKYFYFLGVSFIVGTCIRVGFHDLGFIIGRVSTMLTLTEVFLIPMCAFMLFRSKVFSWILVCVYSLINLVMMLHLRGFGDYQSILSL